MTRYKKALLDSINHAFNHPTIGDLRAMLKEKGFNPSRATVYNNVSSLLEEGLIKKINVLSVSRYDKVLKHDHLVCTKCGEIKDIPSTDVINHSHITEEEKKYISNYDLTLYYVCPSCRSKK